MEDNNLFQIRQNAKNLFVKNGANIGDPRVIAAITDAARYMAIAGDVASKNDTQDAVLAAFGAIDNAEVADLVEQFTPALTNQVIGFSPDYMDYGHSVAVYRAQKNEFDAFYGEVNNYVEAKKNEQSRAI